MPALTGLLLAVFLDLFGLGVIRPVLPIYVQHVFEVDILRVSFIPAAFGIGKLLADVPAGLLMDRLGRARLMAAGLALVALVDLLSAVEPTFPRFLIWRTFAGLGFGFFTTIAATRVLDAAPPHARGRMMGAYLLVGDVGAVLGAGVGGWIYEQFGARMPFFVKAACAATAALASGRTKDTTASPPRGGRGDLRSTLFLPGLVPIAVANMILFMADVGILAILFPLFLLTRGIPPALIGVLVALVVSMQLAALAIGSRLADRWGKVPMFILGLLLYAAGLAALGMVRSNAGIVLSALVLGCGSGAARSVPSALVGDLATPAVRGTAMGIFRTFTDVGMIAGPVLLGALTARAGYGLAFAATAGLLGANAAFFLRTRGIFTHGTHRSQEESKDT